MCSAHHVTVVKGIAILTYQSGPSLRLVLEPYHALCNFVAGHAWRTERLPPGDGHPVLVYPGLGVSGAATADLRTRLLQLGYQVYDWELGVSVWPYISFDAWLRPMGDQLLRIRRAHNRPVSLVGWSLGGLYARELAKLHAAEVRQVITLGTPVGDGLRPEDLALLAALPASVLANEGAALAARLRQAPPVPCASIYSRTDGLVDWQQCVDTHLAAARNIEVEGVSHFGLVHHPRVLAAIAALLVDTPSHESAGVHA